MTRPACTHRKCVWIWMLQSVWHPKKIIEAFSWKSPSPTRRQANSVSQVLPCPGRRESRSTAQSIERSTSSSSSLQVKLLDRNRRSRSIHPRRLKDTRSSRNPVQMKHAPCHQCPERRMPLNRRSLGLTWDKTVSMKAVQRLASGARRCNPEYV